jgi:multidrug efflux pump
VQLPEICIRRPVFATVMSLMILLIGAISFTRLTVREYPKIDTPIVSVRTVYKGASPQVIESQVTTPIEDSISGIEGVRTVKSVSREEVSQVTVEFLPERDVDAAANDVRDRVARVRGVLPDEADESVVSKIEADAQAIMWLAFNSERHHTLELSDYADRYIARPARSAPSRASASSAPPSPSPGNRSARPAVPRPRAVPEGRYGCPPAPRAGALRPPRWRQPARVPRPRLFRPSPA